MSECIRLLPDVAQLVERPKRDLGWSSRGDGCRVWSRARRFLWKMRHPPWLWNGEMELAAAGLFGWLVKQNIDFLYRKAPKYGLLLQKKIGCHYFFQTNCFWRHLRHIFFNLRKAPLETSETKHVFIKFAAFDKMQPPPVQLRCTKWRACMYLSWCSQIRWPAHIAKTK